MSLLLGTAVADITPLEPVELFGFASRSGPWEKVRAPLAAQVFAFGAAAGEGAGRDGAAGEGAGGDGAGGARAAGEGMGTAPVVLVCADLAWWGPDLAPDVREAVASHHHIPPGHVVLHASHTHCAPAPDTTCSPTLGKADTAYLSHVAEAVVEATGRALAAMEPVEVTIGTGQCRIGVNRRRTGPDGAVRLAPEPDGPVDPDVGVVRFARSDGTTTAVLVHYACHPVTSAERQVSPDFPGAMRDKLATALGPPVVVGFLQGCCGDIDPALVRDGEFYRGGDAEIALLGGTLADAALEVLGGPMDDAQTTGRSSVSVSTVDLPLQAPTRDALAVMTSESGIQGEWSRTLLADASRLVDRVPLRLTLLRLGTRLAFVGLGAEVTVPFGLSIKQRYGRAVLPIGYTGGMVGYLVTADQLAAGGYEPSESYLYIYRPGAFAPDAERLVHAAVDALVVGIVEPVAN